MSLLYIECNAGVAGDMLCGALFDALSAAQAEEALRLMNGLELPGVNVEIERAETCGVVGAHVRVLVDGAEEHEHHHHHHEHHEHRSLGDIEALIGGFASLPEAVRANATAVYRSIAEAEAAVHGATMEHIHFHEVGTLDAVVDVTFACLLMHLLAPTRVVVSPVRTGFGQVECAHGVLPVPAPATARLLEGIPAYAGDVEGEFCTPTGAALVRHFADGFGQRPPMAVQCVGYGVGTKRFPIANCVRVFAGEPLAAAPAGGEVLELCCNLDDMTGEDIAFAREQLMAAGALDAWTVPLGMKKGRPGTMLCALCAPERAVDVEAAFFRHTTTLGVRRRAWQRTTLERETVTVETPLGPVRQKIARTTDGSIERVKWEYDDLARLACERGMSLAEARRALGEA